MASTVPPATSSADPAGNHRRVSGGNEGVISVALAIAFAVAVGVLSGWADLRWPISHTPDGDWDFQLSLTEAVGRQLASGHWPWWDPWTAGGVPLWGNPEAPVGHPAAWLAAFVHPALAMRVGLVGLSGLLGLGLVRLVRQLGGGWAAAAVALVAMLGTDAYWWKVGHGHAMMAAAAWIPLALAWLAAEGSPRVRGAKAGIAIAAMAWMGAPYPAFVGAVALAAWGLGTLVVYRGRAAAFAGGLAGLLLSAGHGLVGVGIATALGVAFGAWWGRRSDDEAVLDDVEARKTVGIWITIGIAASVAALLAAPRWLVSAASVGETLRLATAGAAAAADFSGLHALASTWFGSEPQGLAPQLLDGFLPNIDRVPGRHEGLPGWFTPVVGVLAVLGAAAPHANRRVAGLAALLLIGASFGHNLPLDLFAALTALPPLDRFGHPERLALAWTPMLAVLAGLGAERAARWGRPAVAVLVVAGAAHLAVAVPGAFRHADIDQSTPDAYLRLAEDGPPAHALVGVELPGRLSSTDATHFALTAQGHGCLDCGDALQHYAPDGVAPGPWTVEGPATLQAWAPGAIDLVATEAGHISLSEAWRPGWRTDRGQLVATDGRLRLDVAAPGPVQLRYRPPGLGWSLLLFLLGGLLTRWLLFAQKPPTPSR
jgi:hypothetical protein